MVTIANFPFYGITFTIKNISISFDFNFYTLSLGIFCHYSPWISKEIGISVYVGPMQVSTIYNPKKIEENENSTS